MEKDRLPINRYSYLNYHCVFQQIGKFLICALVLTQQDATKTVLQTPVTPKHSRFIQNRNLADTDRGNFNLIHTINYKKKKCVRALAAPWKDYFFENKKEM